jgi:ATP-dependent Lhr-like helicase
VPLAVLAGGEVRFLEEVAAEQEWAARNALLRRQVPPTLAMLG